MDDGAVKRWPLRLKSTECNDCRYNDLKEKEKFSVNDDLTAYPFMSQDNSSTARTLNL